MNTLNINVTLKRLAGKVVREMEFLDMYLSDDKIEGSLRPLFDEDEKETANTILKSLEGISIISAQSLLRKCEKALMQLMI